MFIKKIFIYLCLLSFPCLSWAQNVHEYRLKNGLRLLVKEDHRAPVVISEVWYKVGASYEPDGITGISHALEHMMFRGTRQYGPGVLEHSVEINGGLQNAFTDRDFTAYYQEFSIDKLPISFKLEADRMRNLLLRKQDFEKEIQVVIEERHMRTDDSPTETLMERLNAAAYVSSPYRHPVTGWQSDLNHMTLHDLQQWYDAWYAPNNAIVVVVGDVKPDQVYSLAEKYFAPIKPSLLPPVRAMANVTPLGRQHLDVHVFAQLPWLVMAYPVPVIRTTAGNSDPYVLDLIAALLSTGNSSRLAKHLIRGKQVATDASASYNPFSRLNTLFLLDATPTPGEDLAKLQAHLLEEIKQLQTHTVTDKELARAKTKIAATKIYAQDSIYRQAYQLGSLAAVDLPWQLEYDYLQHINAVTPLKIQCVAKKYLRSDRLTTAYLHPIPIKQGSFAHAR